MDYNTIAVMHKTNPTILALRKNWIPLAVGFLHYVFKRKHEVQIPQDLFLEQLDSYLDHINTALPPDEQYKPDAKYYIDRWSSEDDLVRVRLRDDQYVVQLSPHSTVKFM